MSGDDFSKITTSTLSSCNGSTTEACGNQNDIINNGGFYWYGGTPYSTTYPYYFSSTVKRDKKVNNLFGIRPVIRLNDRVIVTGGSGTYDDPYKIGFEENKKT